MKELRIIWRLFLVYGHQADCGSILAFHVNFCAGDARVTSLTSGQKILGPTCVSTMDLPRNISISMSQHFQPPPLPVQPTKTTWLIISFTDIVSSSYKF